MSDEVYECAGCGGEVAVVEAVWLPEVGKSRPYCCVQCFRANPPQQTPAPQDKDAKIESLKADLLACREQLATVRNEREQAFRELGEACDRHRIEKIGLTTDRDDYRTRYTALHRAASAFARIIPGGDCVLMGPLPNCCVDELGAVENACADLLALLTATPATGKESER